MDKSWMSMDRRSKDYETGVERFIDFAMVHATNSNHILCPCMKCGNVKHHTVDEIRDHLYLNGIDQSYNNWILHGEKVVKKLSTTSNTQSTREFKTRAFETESVAITVEMIQGAYDHFENNPKQFENLLADAEKKLYPSCSKFTKLSVLVKLYSLKARNGWSDRGFSNLLKLLREMLPDNNEMPCSMYEAKKTLNALGMEYEKIHACPNDCILYRNDHKDSVICPNCGAARWKLKKTSTEMKIGVPAKVLWYFPPIPRFKRMFRSVETSKNLTWNATQRETDGLLRHLADTPAWKLIDHLWPDFGAEPRNLRLALSADGINPYNSLSSRYSCWPVIVVTYNFPPWLCMKRKFMMLTLLISGPKHPGNDIDVYLAPLIDDLKILWEVGIEAYDAYRQESFTLKAILMWTINDFPAYGNLAGCTVKHCYRNEFNCQKKKK
ncbi:hypothetical protein AB3S75_002951 [Citrus x aurantiifolia]